MSSVFLMIARFDLPVFKKGDVISVKETSLGEHNKIADNPKFLLIEVTGMTIERAETLLESMIVTYDAEPKIINARLFTVDIDSIIDLSVIESADILAMLTMKEYPGDS